MKRTSSNYLYVLLTAARNEEAYIEKTIQSVISQTILPKKWVIVSDGSTDHTDEIAGKYCEIYDWITLLRMPERNDRSFAGKANCINTGYEMVKDIDFDIIGNIDADVSFEKDYFEFLLDKFLQIPSLGVGGTRYCENDNKVEVYSFKDVAGQCQLFKRGCFEEIGGYYPSRYGGIDWIAVKTARMKGWETITFDEKTFFHHRIMCSAETNKWVAKVKAGRKDYFLGNHPLWEFFRIVYQMTRKPFLVGGFLLMYGYSKGFLSRMEKPISQDLISFNRKEQMQRLKLIFENMIKLKVKIEET